MPLENAVSLNEEWSNWCCAKCETAGDKCAILTFITCLPCLRQVNR